jgi:hypothetical protein
LALVQDSSICPSCMDGMISSGSGTAEAARDDLRRCAD